MIKKISLVKLLILFLSLSVSNNAFTQECNYTSSQVKSVYFEKDGSKLAYPVISLTGENITIHFDVLSSHQETLYYKLIHCDREWNLSDIFYSDYAEGFDENPLSDSEGSFNTIITYSHYKLTLPNDDISFKISGNYLLKVYASGEEDKPLLCRRLCIHEDAASVSVLFKKPMGKAFYTGQESEIKVSVKRLVVTDPYRQITISILQNGRWDKSRLNLRPDFVGEGTVEYNTLSGATLFQGGSEFRYFDIKTIRQKMQNVREIAFKNNNYHVFLLPSESREDKQYFFDEDLNGQFLIARENDDDPDRDADYVYVYFTLPVAQEITNGSVYVSGALTNWEYIYGNKMVYNPTNHWYEATLLLKQGWYNYEFNFIPDGQNIPLNEMFEGSHYETENDYLVLVYFRDPQLRYDRLVNAITANTRGSN
jgi:hypothetical protein